MLAENCQVCFFSEHLFQGHPVSNAREFQAIPGLWFHPKSNITNMITVALACRGNNLNTITETINCFFHIHFCGLKTVKVVTFTFRTVVRCCQSASPADSSKMRITLFIVLTLEVTNPCHQLTAVRCESLCSSFSLLRSPIRVSC